MKLTCVTAVFNAIKSGNRENLIRCVRSVAALKTPHEHLIYDGASTDGTVELLRELEREVNGGDGCAREGTSTTGVFDRRACAEKKVAEWLSGVDETAFEAALVKLVEEKSAAGEYRFKKSEERELALDGARKFYREFARKIVPLSDGRYVYFAPDERAKMRNASNAISWAEYAFHAVSNGGAKISGKNYNERWYNPHKQPAFALIERVLKQEKCFIRLSSAGARFHAIVFAGTEETSARLQVVTRLDDDGNIDANLSEVTFTASHKEKKLPRLVPLTEAVRTVVHYQTATGSYPPNGGSIANPCGDDKGGGGESGAHTAISVKCEVRSEKGAELSGLGHAQVEDSTPFVDNKIAFFLNGVKGGGEHSILRVVSEPDTGIYNALNKGVRDAKGEWFYVLGCDDYIYPENVDAIMTDADSTVAMVVALFDRSDKRTQCSRPNFWREAILYNSPHCHQCVVMRTDVVRALGGFDERYRIIADGDMMQKIHHAAMKITYIPKLIACYGAGGFSECDEELRIRELTDIIKRHYRISQSECDRLFARGYASISTILKCLMHRDPTLRFAGRHMFCGVFRHWLRYAFYPLVVITRPLRYGTFRKGKKEA